MANYFIIGGDGKEYGPVSNADARQWLAAGRINAQSQAKAEGDAEFRPLAQFPEFADVFAPRAAAASASPPPLSAGAPAPAKTSGLAITSLVLGILGVFTCGVTALVGLILGIVAMVKVKNSGGKLGGHGLALAGIIVSAIFLLMLPLLPFMVALMLPALAAGRQTAMQINCMNNEKQLALTVLMYSNDHTNHYPAAATWCDAIKPSAGSEKIFKCPAGNPASRCDYAFNAKLDGLDDSKIDPQTVMIFESDTGWNAHGERELLANRHRANSSVVAFADGHVEMVSSSRVATLRWDP